MSSSPVLLWTLETNLHWIDFLVCFCMLLCWFISNFFPVVFSFEQNPSNAGSGNGIWSIGDLFPLTETSTGKQGADLYFGDWPRLPNLYSFLSRAIAHVPEQRKTKFQRKNRNEIRENGNFILPSERVSFDTYWTEFKFFANVIQVIIQAARDHWSDLAL